MITYGWSSNILIYPPNPHDSQNTYVHIYIYICVPMYLALQVLPTHAFSQLSSPAVRAKWRIGTSTTMVLSRRQELLGTLWRTGNKDILCCIVHKLCLVWYAVFFNGLMSCHFTNRNVDSTFSAVQSVMGAISLRALWTSRRRSKSKLIIYLIIHTLCLGLVNVVGLITNAVSFSLVSLPLADESLEPTCRNYITEAQMNTLSMVSTVAFGISGVLTDAILVSTCDGKPFK